MTIVLQRRGAHAEHRLTAQEIPQAPIKRAVLLAHRECSCRRGLAPSDISISCRPTTDGDDVAHLPEFRLETHLDRWEFAAQHHMTASDVETMPMAELLELASEAEYADWTSLRLGYTEVSGDPQLRAAIAATHTQAHAEDVICFAGAEEGLYLAMQALLEPEDHAVVITPNYQSAETVPLSRCAVTGVALDPAQHWALDVDQIVAALRPNTRMVYVNFPHNPTGAIPPQEEFRRLVQLCDERGIHVFSDEVYRGLELGTRTALPQASDLSERALSLNVTSKSLGLPGLRIGWITCRDPEVRRRLLRAKHYTTICNSAPSEILARIALTNRPQLLQRTRAVLTANMVHFDAFFAEFADLFEWSHPDGGCVAFPRYLGTDGVEQMCHEVLHEAGVLLLPASVFHSELTPTPTDRFRIGFGRAEPQAGLEAFAAWLRKRAPRPAPRST